MNDQNPQVQPVWVKRPKSPPADVLYAHKLGRGLLLPYQIAELVKPINPAYVAKKGNNSYLAHHQARAEMNRIFGYGNWDTDVQDVTLIYETAMPGTGSKSNTTYYRACYRGRSIVNVRDLWGMPVATYTGVHAEANSNLPDQGEAHAMALTSLESYALRRALINLGDRFGLGLYNGGSLAPHGQYTVQLEGGVLFDWVDQNAQDAPPAPTATPAPYVQPSHATIQAEPAIADDYVAPAEDAQPGAEVPAAPAKRAPRQTAAQKRENFQAAAAQVQEGNMQARIQAGMKRDEPQPEDHPADEYAGPSDVG